MSGQYPSGFNNQVGGHHTNFNSPMMNQMNMQMPQHQQMGGMMNYNQGMGGMMTASSQQSTMQGAMGAGLNVPNNNTGMVTGGPAGMQSPSHTPQQLMKQVPQQSQQTPQQPQLTLTTPTTPSTGMVPILPNQVPVGATAGAPGGPPVGPTPPAAPQKEFNIVSLCRFGQETVQDIVSRFQEVFQALRQIQLPNGINSTSTEKKVQEHFRTIRLLFKRVRILYDKCNDSCQQGMEYTHVESLIPLKDDPDHKPEPIPSEDYKKALQENRELTETAMLKNKQLREIIDRMRIIIWEINTMLSMRKS